MYYSCMCIALYGRAGWRGAICEKDLYSEFMHALHFPLMFCMHELITRNIAAGKEEAIMEGREFSIGSDHIL